MSAELPERDLSALEVPRTGRVVATGDPLEPYRLLNENGVPVAAVASYFRELLAASRSASTLRSYAHLCRERHKWAYAEPPDMPLLGVKLLAGWSVMPCSIGIIFGLLHKVTD
ncbi:hypothetical protein [Nonomuraea sp. 10N515B]|uniref:hypothetical protein n=1 Tax=Nonomuraea sp. 10N515B TaxID=3457422 RepID=UPI003FCDA730